MKHRFTDNHNDHRHAQRSDGNVMLLALGILTVMLGLLAFVIDLGHAYTRHIAIVAASERIVLAGASAIDSQVEATSSNPGTRLRLAPKAAIAAVREATSLEVSEWRGLQVSDIQVSLTTVQVRACGPIRFPLAWRGLTKGAHKVCARAAAATAISWTQYP